MKMHLYGKELLTSDIQKVLQRFLGERTKRALNFQLKIQYRKNITTADARFIKFAEFLTGHIGTASAKI
jgi:hypothetical protein